jgi:hypothetical protein
MRDALAYVRDHPGCTKLAVAQHVRTDGEHLRNAYLVVRRLTDASLVAAAFDGYRYALTAAPEGDPVPLTVPPPGQVPPRGWKNQAKQWCRDLVARVPDGEPVPEADDAVLRQLAQRHPDYAVKAGCGIAGFTTATEARYATRHLVVLRTDGTSTDMSWQECIKPSAHRTDALGALRRAAEPQVHAAKDQLRPVTPDCVLCGEPLDGDVHADHHPVPFLTIAEEFAAAQGGWSGIIVDKDGDGRIGCELSADLTVPWQQFHAEHAGWRLLHPECHQRLRQSAVLAPESGTEIALTAENALAPPLPKTPKPRKKRAPADPDAPKKARAPKLTEEEKAAKALAKREQAALDRQAARDAKVAELGGPLVTLPAVVMRDGAVHPVDAATARAFLEPSLAELSVDTESTGFAIGHRFHSLRLVQLGNAAFAVVFDPGDPEQAEVVRWALMEARVLHAHSAQADIGPLHHAGLADGAMLWSKTYDTVHIAKLIDPAMTDSDEGSLKALARTMLGDAYALSWSANETRKAIFAAGGWLTDTEPDTALERSGWAMVPICESFVKYAAFDVLDCASVWLRLSSGVTGGGTPAIT